MKEQRRKHSIGKAILAVVLVVLLLAGAGYFVYVYFQVEDVQVKGNSSFDANAIVKLANIEPKTHMFVLDTDAIRQRVEEEPYLQVDSVLKQYPKTVVINVTERQPKALIEYADSYLLVDQNANVLEILDEKPEQQYPVVSGIAISSVNLGKSVDTQDTFKISVLSDILKELEARDLYAQIENIDLSDVNNIKLLSYEGMNIQFGQSDKVAEKMRWIKTMLPKLSADGNTSGIMDVSSGTGATYRMNGETQPAGTPSPDAQGTDDAGQSEPVPTDVPEE